LGAELEIPIPPDASFSGQVSDLKIGFDQRGLPKVQVEGLGMGIEDVQTGPMKLTGSVYLGGLDDPTRLFFAGQLGGTLNGAGVIALAAFGMDGPRGVCLDVNAGPAGIPLGPSGFLLTGVAGGVSFADTSQDPCEFRSYVQLDDEGKPVTDPKPLPAPQRERQQEGPVVTTPAPMPDASDKMPCPEGDCPPPAMSILCQPHSDQVKYPDRAIIKFTALDKGFVDQVLERLDIDRNQLEKLTAENIAERISGDIRREVERLWPLEGTLDSNSKFSLKV
jgi:hypothetical protein